MEDLLRLATIVVAFVVALWTYIWWSCQYWQRIGVPCVPLKKHKPKIPFPIQMKELYKEGKAKGYKFFGIYILASPKLVVLDLDLLKHVMTKDFKHFMDRKTYTNEKGEPLTSHLGAVDGDKWKNLRPKLSPTFTSGKMKNMLGQFLSSAQKLEHHLTVLEQRKEVVDIKKAAERFGIDIIGSCAFGLECNAFTESNSPFLIFTEKLLSRSKWRNVKDLLTRLSPTLFRLSGMKIMDAEVTEFFTNLVRDTIRYREENNIRRNDFLQSLIDLKDDGSGAEGKLSFDEIAAQCFVFFSAGFETSSVTITFTLFEMSQNLQIQEKLREEISKVLEKYDNKVTYEALNDMKYLEQVINESLRIHNPVPINGRACSETYKIPGTDIVLPKGTKVLIPTIAIHHDEEYYPDPEKFDPERFNEDNTKKRHPYAFIPLGEGPRICIGGRFGIMQTKMGLITILRNFRVKLSDKTPLPLKMTVNFAPVTRIQQTIWLELEKL